MYGLQENEEKENQNEDEYVETDVRNRLNTMLAEVTQHVGIDKALLPLYVLTCEEHFMYAKHKQENEGKPVSKPTKEMIQKVVNKFENAFKKTKLDQILAIAEAKLVIHYVAVYMSKVLSRKGSKFTKKGLMLKDKIAIHMNYFQVLNQLFKISDGNTNNTLTCIKTGLQYFMICSLWNSVLGPSRAMLYLKSNVFAKTLNVNMKFIMNEIIDDAKDIEHEEKTQFNNIPKDNPFLLMLNEQNDANIYVNIEKAFESQSKVNWHNNTKYALFIVAVFFNIGYIKRNIDMEITIRTANNLSKTIAKMHKIKENNNYKRIKVLFTSLAHNRMSQLLQFSKTKRLQDVQLIRMMYHLIGVILSLPQSPLSTLFHDPISFDNGYLCGMPEDSSTQLFKTMVGVGVWLCPNNHLYFIENCSWPYQSSICTQCDAPTGKRQGGGFHEPAPGNKRIGKIGKNGEIVVEEQKDPYSDRVYNNEEIAILDIKTLTPKGYIDVGDADDVVRNMNSITIRIIRLFVNIVLLIHECCDEQLSNINKIRPFENLKHKQIYSKLMKFIKRYINEIGTELGIKSTEDTVYILHNIINDFYCKYPKWIKSKDNKDANDIYNIEARRKFEMFLTIQCIQPTINNINDTIHKVRQQCCDKTMRFWAERIGETLDLNSENGELFSKLLKPNLFLQFRWITLHQFQTQLLSLPIDEKNKLKILYPITYGILECLNLDIGYSIFALKYLPKMITWMKLIKSRLNQRLKMNEVLLNKNDKYTAQWILNQCNKYDDWGAIDEWNEALQGFICGWNHIAELVTVDRNKENTLILLEKKEDEKNADDEVKIESNNPFKKFLVIKDHCEPLTILKIEPKKKSKDKQSIQPSDVQLSFALDSNAEDFDTSKMIRFMIQHLVGANNKLLKMCYNLDENDNGESVGLSPTLSTTELSIQRENDIVGVDEGELIGMIQQCTEPRLLYGEDNKLNIKSFNLRLLEMRLRQKYIIGRKLLQYDRVIFEFAGQENIPNIINIINERYKLLTNDTIIYFQKTPGIKNELIWLKNAINDEINNNGIVEENEYERDFDDEKMDIQQINKIMAFKSAMQTVEQTLIAISRLETYPNPEKKLWEYMRNTLHSDTYTPFQQTKLQLQHMAVVWRYLEKEYVISEGKWTVIPNKVMDCYRKKLGETQKQDVNKFAFDQSTDDLWIFLCSVRRFMERNCKTMIPNYDKAQLKLYLEYVEDIEPKMIDEFSNDIMLNQIGDVYETTAISYQSRLNDQQN